MAFKNHVIVRGKSNNLLVSTKFILKGVEMKTLAIITISILFSGLASANECKTKAESAVKALEEISRGSEKITTSKIEKQKVSTSLDGEIYQVWTFDSQSEKKSSYLIGFWKSQENSCVISDISKVQ